MQRHSDRQDRVPGKHRRSPPGEAVLPALPLQVPPHVFALLPLEDEGRAVPSERLEDRTEQERLPLDGHPRQGGEALDAHDAEVAGPAGHVEPELDGWWCGAHSNVTRHRTSMLVRGGASGGVAGWSKAA